MKDIHSVKQGRETREIKQPKTPRMAKQKTVLHMGVYDIEAADKIRIAMHRMYFEAVDNNPRALVACFELLDQLYIVVKFAVSESLRKTTDKKMKTTRDKIRALRSQVNKSSNIKLEDFILLRDEVQDRIEDIYQIKQIAGMGMPTEVVQDDETLLDEAMRS